MRRKRYLKEKNPFQSEESFHKYLSIYWLNWKSVVRSDPCAYCGKVPKVAKRTLDHIIPKSNGGPSGYGNIVGACLSCNMQKGSRPFLKWILTCGKNMKAHWKQVGAPWKE